MQIGRPKLFEREPGPWTSRMTRETRGARLLFCRLYQHTDSLGPNWPVNVTDRLATKSEPIASVHPGSLICDSCDWLRFADRKAPPAGLNLQMKRT